MPGSPQLRRRRWACENGTLDFDTPDFTLKLVKDSQTIAALQPKGAKGMDANTPFDFTPADQLTARQGDRFNHLGDITLRVKQTGWQDGAWVDLASSDARKPVTRRRRDVQGSLPARAADSRRRWPAAADLERADGGPAERAAAAGSTRRALGMAVDRVRPPGPALRRARTRAQRRSTIGGLGFPVVFNNMIQNFVTNRARTLPQAHEICSFFDPYVGRDAGYLQVTRLSGAGPALVVVPEPGTKTPFEAFRPLNDASRRGQTFEGAFEWTVAQPGATRRTSGRT